MALISTSTKNMNTGRTRNNLPTLATSGKKMSELLECLSPKQLSARLLSPTRLPRKKSFSKSPKDVDEDGEYIPSWVPVVTSKSNPIVSSCSVNETSKTFPDFGVRTFKNISPITSPKSKTRKSLAPIAKRRPPLESILLHTGNKHFWRINTRVDFRIYLVESCGAIVVRSFDPLHDRECRTIVLDWNKVLLQVERLNEISGQLQLEKVATSTQGRVEPTRKFEALSEMLPKKEKKTFPSIPSPINRRNSEMNAKQQSECVQSKEGLNDHEKAVAIIVNRLEVKSFEGVLSVYIEKRDNNEADFEFKFESLVKDQESIDEVKEALMSVGREDASATWNKRECPHVFRRHSTQINSELDEVNQSTLLAMQQQNTVKILLDTVSTLSTQYSDGKEGNNWKKGVNKVIFRNNVNKSKMRYEPSSPKT